MSDPMSYPTNNGRLPAHALPARSVRPRASLPRSARPSCARPRARPADCPLYFLHMLQHFALRGNDGFLFSTEKGYRELVKKAKQMPTNDDDVREINFAVKQAARAKHHSRRRYWLSVFLKEEIIFLRKILQDDTVHLSTPIGHWPHGTLRPLVRNCG